MNQLATEPERQAPPRLDDVPAAIHS